MEAKRKKQNLEQGQAVPANLERYPSWLEAAQEKAWLS